MTKGRKTGRIIEGYWSCPYCGNTKILARYRECPGCGKPKGIETNFEIGEKNYVKNPEEISRNPDWLCSYCNCLNSDNNTSCTGCGASKFDSEKNYFQMKAEREKKETHVTRMKNNNEYVQTKPIIKEQHDDNDFQEETSVPDVLDHMVEEKKKNFSIPIINWRKITSISISIIVGLLLILGLIWLFTPEQDTLFVEKVAWNYSISIEEKQTFDESDWDVPIGARVYDEQEEIHHYEKVIDYYETVEVEKYEDVIVGYEYEYEDLGNGYFEEVEGDPIYERQYYTEQEEVPVYKEVEVYQTKYYYYIDRWVFKRSVDTNGTDKNPYFGEVILGHNEREGSKTKNYSIIATNEAGEVKTYNISESQWKEIDEKDILDVEITKFGTISEILEIKKD